MVMGKKWEDIEDIFKSSHMILMIVILMIYFMIYYEFIKCIFIKTTWNKHIIDEYFVYHDWMHIYHMEHYSSNTLKCEISIV